MSQCVTSEAHNSFQMCTENNTKKRSGDTLNSSFPNNKIMIRGNFSINLERFSVSNDQLRLSTEAISNGVADGPGILPDGFRLKEADVICGRGKKVIEHNESFRSMVATRLDEYNDASSKAQKSAVVSSVFDDITAKGGAFVKQDRKTGKWFMVSEHAAREKISQCLRDCLTDKYQSSKKCKREKRKYSRAVAKMAKGSPSPRPAKKSKATISMEMPEAPSACTSNEAYHQLVMYAKSVLPPDPPAFQWVTSSEEINQEFADLDPLPLHVTAHQQDLSFFCLSGDSSAEDYFNGRIHTLT